MQANETVGGSDLPSLRLSRHRMVGTAVGLALANGGGLQYAWGQAYGTLPIELPPVSVEGARGGQQGYKVDQPANSKLTQPLVSTPNSIIEVPRKLLDDEGVTTMRDALRNVPGVSLAAGEGGQQGDNLSIRGFNAQNDFFLDGIRDFGSYYRDPFNLQSLEVLEGPASVLFGRGSTGGSVNQVSKQPQIMPVTQGTISFGTDGMKRVTADVNRAIDGIRGAAIRLNLMGDLNGTAGRDSVENRRFGFAPEIALGLGTPTRFNLDYYHIQANDTPDYGIPWLNGTPAPVAHNNFYGSDHDFFRTSVDIVTAKIEHDFNDNITVSDQFRYGSYQRNLHVTEPLILNQGPARGFVTPGIPIASILVSRNIIALNSLETIIDNQTNATMSFDTGPFHHTLLSGVELSRQTTDPTRFTFPQPTTNLLNPGLVAPTPLTGTISTIATSHTDNIGAYAVDTLAITPKLDLLGGFRFDQFNTKFDQVGTTVAHLSRNDALPSYNAAIVYKPVPNASIYYRYGTSFDPSGESLSLSVATASVAPEKTTTHEIGGKWDVLQQRMSLTGSIYQIQKANARETDPNNPTLDILGGNYRVRGFQVAAAGHLTNRWELFGGYSYNDAIVVSSPNPLEVGHAPPNAPQHTLTLFTSYQLPWHNIELGGGMNFVTSRTAASTPVAGTTTIQRAPGYVTMSLMAKYPVTDNISLQANVTNVTDTYYYDQLHPSHIILGPSRAALFTLNVKL
jgi:catecholate siderophore receptor